MKGLHLKDSKSACLIFSGDIYIYTHTPVFISLDSKNITRNFPKIYSPQMTETRNRKKSLIHKGFHLQLLAG